MKMAFSLLPRVLLIVCLTIYGPFAPTGASGGNGGILMEICGDGGATTIAIDARGNPVTPAADCFDCLSCCQAAAAMPGTPWVARMSRSPWRMPAQLAPVEIAALLTPNTRPLPRAPPLSQPARLTQPGPIATGSDSNGCQTHDAGRPIFKDAIA